MTGRDGRFGIARVSALVLGLVFVAASITMSVTQDRLSWLQYSALLDGIEWGLGALLLLSAIAGESVARTVLRIAGVALVAGAAAGWLARAPVGDWLGFAVGAGLPGSHAVWFGLTGVAALVVGFASRGGKA